MNENRPGLPSKVEVLAPERAGTVRDSGRPMVVSAFYRVRNRVLTKELESFAAKGRAWNEIVAILRDGERLRQEYVLTLERSKHLPFLQAAEEAKVLAEVQKIFDEEADRQLERNVRRTRAEAELIKAQRDLDALKNPPSPKRDESRSKKRVAAIKRIREERDEMIAIIMDDRSESDLSEEDAQLIGDVRLAADNEIKNLLEDGHE